MVYVKQTWANGASGETPLSAARLNYMETGIETVSADGMFAPYGTLFTTSADGLTSATSIVGVDATGATDSTGPLNAWLAAPPAGSAGLWFPPGTYVASLRVTTPNLRLSGTRKSVIKVPDNATQHVNDAGIRVLANGVSIEGLAVNGNFAGNPALNTLELSENSDGIGIYANDVTVSNCHIYDPIGHGIIVWGLAFETIPAAPRSGFLIDGNRVQAGTRRASIDVAFNQHAVTDTRGILSNNRITGNTLICHSANDVIISGNYCGGGMSLHTGCERLTVVGNICPGQVLGLSSLKDSTVTENTAQSLVLNIGTGVVRPSNVILSGNVISSLVQVIGADGVTVSGNTAPAIELNNTTLGLVDNNRFTSDIRIITGCSRIQVSGNQGPTVRTNASSKIAITGNDLSGSAQYGIWVTGGDDFTIRGNRVASCVSTSIRVGNDGLATTNVVVNDNIVTDGTDGVMIGVNITTATVARNTFKNMSGLLVFLSAAAAPTTTLIGNGKSYGRIIAPPAATLAQASPAAWGGANQALLSRFSLDTFTVLKYARFQVGTASGNIQVGVVKFNYESSTAYVRVMNSGIVACPATGIAVVDLGAYEAVAGDYAVFLWADNTTFTTPILASEVARAMRLTSTVVSIPGGVPASGVIFEGSVNTAVLGLCLETDL